MLTVNWEAKINRSDKQIDFKKARANCKSNLIIKQENGTDLYNAPLSLDDETQQLDDETQQYAIFVQLSNLTDNLAISLALLKFLQYDFVNAGYENFYQTYLVNNRDKLFCEPRTKTITIKKAEDGSFYIEVLASVTGFSPLKDENNKPLLTFSTKFRVTADTSTTAKITCIEDSIVGYHEKHTSVIHDLIATNATNPENNIVISKPTLSPPIPAPPEPIVSYNPPPVSKAKTRERLRTAFHSKVITSFKENPVESVLILVSFGLLPFIGMLAFMGTLPLLFKFLTTEIFDEMHALGKDCQAKDIKEENIESQEIHALENEQKHSIKPHKQIRGESLLSSKAFKSKPSNNKSKAGNFLSTNKIQTITWQLRHSSAQGDIIQFLESISALSSHIKEDPSNRTYNKYLTFLGTEGRNNLNSFLISEKVTNAIFTLERLSNGVSNNQAEKSILRKQSIARDTLNNLNEIKEALQIPNRPVLKGRYLDIVANYIDERNTEQ